MLISDEGSERPGNFVAPPGARAAPPPGTGSPPGAEAWRAGRYGASGSGQARARGSLHVPERGVRARQPRPTPSPAPARDGSGGGASFLLFLLLPQNRSRESSGGAGGAPAAISREFVAGGVEAVSRREGGAMLGLPWGAPQAAPPHWGSA